MSSIGPVAPGAYNLSGMSPIGGEKFEDEQALTITGSAPVSIQLNLK